MDRIFGDGTYILRLVSRVEYLESLPCDGQPLGWPARRSDTVRSEAQESSQNRPRMLLVDGGATLRRRAGISRSCPSQGSLSMYSTPDTKRNMYVSSPKTSIRGRRADGTVCRVASARCALGATDSDRIFGRWHIHITFGITSRVLGKTALRREASGDASAAPERCPTTSNIRGRFWGDY